ncbi:nucleotidyltransferase [Streptococcus halichoeri]|uniref:nucleotidyltransferase n=1 Tax=Streptococcus halichoeri TaxID=254785 RepID=UPI001359CD39|nr:nucleotidyltransferase [Streptococcus halichoeri]
MTVTGIIAEFNPFHNGHKYLLDQVDSLKIVAMSGNFVQRGEPAIVDKWTRTQMALVSGADLVVELPFLVAVQSADYFAEGAMAILHQLGVEQLAFGTEEIIDYNQIGADYLKQKHHMQQFLDKQPEHLSYPQKAQSMWQQFAGLHFSGATPNHILGLAYAKAASEYGIRLHPIQRQGASYHSKEKAVAYASATSLRLHRDDHAFVAEFMPSAQLFQESPQVTWQDYFALLKYQIMTHPDLTQVYQVNQELANRLRQQLLRVESVEELVEAVATKRYTKARIRRLLAYILVNVREAQLPSAIHVLGFSPAGQEYLKTRKKTVDLRTRIGAKPWDPLTQRADAVYQLGNGRLAEQTWGRIPVQKE